MLSSCCPHVVLSRVLNEVLFMGFRGAGFAALGAWHPTWTRTSADPSGEYMLKHNALRTIGLGPMMNVMRHVGGTRGILESDV
jgi:hypothetical protein